MNTLITKQAVLYSLIFGAALALFGSFNFLIGLVAFILALLCAPAVILFMKKTNKIGFLESQQAATLGGLCGFCATISFFLIFTPMTLIFTKFAPLVNKILPFISGYHYAYGLQYIVTFDSLWLFFIIVIMIAGVGALTNSTTAMGTVFLLAQFEQKPKDIEEIDIHIE